MFKVIDTRDMSTVWANVTREEAAKAERDNLHYTAYPVATTLDIVNY